MKREPRVRSRSRSLLRGLLSAGLGLFVLGAAGEARAWYFPEHVVIARDAVEGLAPEIRAIVKRAVDEARAGDLSSLCAEIDVGLEDLSASSPLRTQMLRADVGVDCVPFPALPALAADHADGVVELRALLEGSKARELTTAAAHEWRRFLDVVGRVPKAPIERMSFVHELDVDFYFIDPGYELRAQRTRAHFVDAGRSLDDVVENAVVAGAVDNAVGQFLAHHLRSLQLAARKEVSEALLEHAFAIHFLEDAFSAGHLVMTGSRWSRGNGHVRSRHDFFDASGVRVRRATSAEDCLALDRSFEAGLPACWTASGDGYLGIARDSSDRAHVVRAVKKADLALAMALDAQAVISFAEGLGEREQIAVGDFFEPMPWWTLARRTRKTRPPTAAQGLRLVRAAARAIGRLREGPSIPRVDVGRAPRGALFRGDIVRTALDPCATVEADADELEQSSGCGEGRALAFGTIGASLVRPILVELPAARDDVSTLEGEAATDHGMAFHLLASVATSALFPDGGPVDLYTPGLGVSMGIAYRFGNYLPGRRDRSALELNVGVGAALHFDTHGDAGGHPQVTLLEQEIRWPILWEGLTSYLLPLDLRRSHEAGAIIVLGGARVREMLSGPTPRLWGVDLELAAVALSNGLGAYPLYSVSPEIRIHAGMADPSVAQPSLAGTWSPTVSVTFTGGYATFF